MRTILGIGTNLGDRTHNIEKAITLLSEIIPNIKCAPLFESQALLKEDAPEEWNIPFLNSVLYGDTNYSPHELLTFCQSIETKMGRDKDHPIWSPRIIDIDILLYENCTLNEPNLTIPHPEMLHRLFVMLPLQEVETNFLSPLWNQHFAKTPEKIIYELSSNSANNDIPTHYSASSQ